MMTALSPAVGQTETGDAFQDRLLNWIGTQAEGTRIPSTKELCRLYDEGMRNVCNGLARLEGRGWIRRESPRIRVVSRPAQPSRDNAAAAAASRWRTTAVITPIDMINLSNSKTFIYAQFVLEVLRVLGKNRHDSLVLSCESEPERLTERLLAVDGAVALPQWGAMRKDGAPPVWLERPAVPTVAQCDEVPSFLYDRLGCDLVGSDHRAGGALLVDYLVRRGRRRLMPVGIEETPLKQDQLWHRERLAGYEEGARRAGVELLPLCRLPAITGRQEEEGRFEDEARMAMGFLYEGVVRAKADGLLVMADLAAAPVARALRLLGVVCGEDVLLAGYDDCYTEFPGYRWEPNALAATVNHEYAAVADEMVRTLRQRRRGEAPPEPLRRVVKPRLVVLDDGGN